MIIIIFSLYLREITKFKVIILWRPMMVITSANWRKDYYIILLIPAPLNLLSIGFLHVYQMCNLSFTVPPYFLMLDCLSHHSKVICLTTSMKCSFQLGRFILELLHHFALEPVKMSILMLPTFFIEWDIIFSLKLRGKDQLDIIVSYFICMFCCVIYFYFIGRQLSLWYIKGKKNKHIVVGCPNGQ